MSERSILDRWKADAELPERGEDQEREAKELTDRILARMKAAMDPKNLPVIKFGADPARLEVLVNAAKWFLPAAIRDFWDFEGKRKELRALRLEIKQDPDMPSGERAQKLRLIERKLGTLNQLETGFDAFSSFGGHSIDRYSQEEDYETLSKICATVVAMLPLVKEARAHFGITVNRVDADGELAEDVFDELGL